MFVSVSVSITNFNRASCRLRETCKHQKFNILWTSEKRVHKQYTKERKESSTHHHTGYESILKHRRLSSSLTASISSLRYRADPLSESTRFPITVYRFPFGSFHYPDSDGPLDLRS
ncbi:hypothetical protein ACLKA6_016194 [Drosophila palustris]